MIVRLKQKLFSIPKKSQNDPRIKKQTSKKHNMFINKTYKSHCFVIDNHFDPKFHYPPPRFCAQGVTKGSLVFWVLVLVSSKLVN